MPRRTVGLIPQSNESTHPSHRPPLLLPRFPHRLPQLLHRSKATSRRKIGLIRNRTDLAANRVQRKDRPKKKARGLAPPRSAVVLVSADGGRDHAAPADVSRSEDGPHPHGGAIAQYPALHMHGRYAEEMAKLDEARQEGPSRELNRWDVALEIFTKEEAYRLRRIVDKVAQPVNERREALGLSVHDDDGGGGGDDDVLDGAALPAGSNNGVTLLRHGNGGVPCVGSGFVMGANSYKRVPGYRRDRVVLMQQDNGFRQPCSTISMHPDASGMGGYQQRRIATINHQLDVCQQSTAQHEYGFHTFQGICNGGVQPTDGNCDGAPPSLTLTMSYGDDLMNAGSSLQTDDTDSQHYLCYPEDMHMQDCNSGENIPLIL